VTIVERAVPALDLAHRRKPYADERLDNQVRRYRSRVEYSRSRVRVWLRIAVAAWAQLGRHDELTKRYGLAAKKRACRAASETERARCGTQ
jgi:hypothetical protein